jgi:hypothetical protein
MTANQSSAVGAPIGNSAVAGPFAGFTGVDSSALAKLQEALAAAGGAGMFSQQNSQPIASNQSPTGPTAGSNNNEADTASNAATAANNAFASLLSSQFGGQNASLLAAQIQAATQPRVKSEDDSEANN